MLSVLPVRRPATITVVFAPISCVRRWGLLKYTFFCAIVGIVLWVREKRVKFQIDFLELNILNVDGFGPVLRNHGRDFVGYVGDRLDAENTRIIGSREGLNKDLVERYGLFVFEVNAVELALGK